VLAKPTPPSDTPASFDAAYLDNPRPAYPAVSRQEGEQGTVVLKVHVLPTGLADQVELDKSSGFDRLDKAARSTVARWRFTPARQGERPIAAWVQVPIDFYLKRAQP
jgi:protein TonB